MRASRLRRHRALVVTLATVAVVAGLAPSRGTAAARDAPVRRCDWPMWGHGPDRRFSYPCATDIAPDTVGGLQRVWFFRARDTVTATPAVVRGTVFVGDWSGNFYALRAKNGRVKWRFQAETHPLVYAGQIVSSAAVARMGGVRTVFFGAGKHLYALRARDGKLLWRYNAGRRGDDADDDPTEIETSPVVVDGKVIFGTDVHNRGGDDRSRVIALDAETGERIWARTTAPTSGRDPTGPGCGDVWGSVAVDVDGRGVFFGTGNCVSAPEGWGRFSEAIVALDLDTGAPRWTYQPHEPNRNDLDFAGAPNLFSIGDRPVVGLGNKDAAYYVVDRQTGELVWATQTTEPGLRRPDSNFSTGGFIGPAAYADDRIVGGTAVGGSPALHAMNADTGAIIWQQPAAGPTYAATTEANGVLFLGGTDFTLRALDAATGDVLWQETMTGAVSGGTAIVGDNVYAVAGIREPGTDKRSRTSGVTRFSLSARPVPSTSSTTTGQDSSVDTTPRPAPSTCVDAPCSVAFDLKTPPPGTSPRLTLSITVDPWGLEAQTEDLGPPSAWLRPGSDAAREGATRYGLFISERDDDPNGGLLCVLDNAGGCSTSRIPQRGATYNRISLLAITDSDELPEAAEGFDRLVTTQSFSPPLAPRR